MLAPGGAECPGAISEKVQRLPDSLSKLGEAQSDALCVAACMSLHASLLIVELDGSSSD